ncbi:MAG: FAD-dependent oxidoreductase [Saprospiraceae bacterium]
MTRYVTVLLCWVLLGCQPNRQAAISQYDVVVVGGGASGVMAAIQSAKMGASTLLVEETPWLGVC